MNGPLRRLERAAWGREGSRPAPALAAFLRPFSWAFGAISRVRGRYYDRRGGTRVPGIAVVSVGNLAVGGTGKTPLAAWAARALAGLGARPAVVLRGYGRDEAELHRTWRPDLSVIVGRDRVRAVRAARDAGARVAVLDDAFQHRRLARDLDLVLLAAEDPLPARLLPAGPYRERWSALARAHVVVLTRRTAALEDARRLEDALERAFPALPVACARLAVTSWKDLHGTPVPPPVGPALVVAAVARPEAVRVEVERLTGSEAELLAFRDHHELSPGDLRRMAGRAAGRPVVVTEKDAVKLRGLLVGYERPAVGREAAPPGRGGASSGGEASPSRRGAGSPGGEAPSARRAAASAPFPPVHVAVESLLWDWGADEVLGLLERLVRPGTGAPASGPPPARAGGPQVPGPPPARAGAPQASGR